MKRPFEQESGQPPAKRGPGTGGRITMPCVLKLLAPEPLASAVIGKGGAVIKAIRDATGTRLTFTDQREVYPGTDCRVLTAQGETEIALSEVAAQIILKLDECVQVTPSESLGHPGELRIRALVPRAAAGGLIGKGGIVIKQLREQTGARINISDAAEPGPQADQVVSVSGPPPSVEQVMVEINRQIQAVGHEGWFMDWASNTGAGVGGGKGCGRGGYFAGPPVHRGNDFGPPGSRGGNDFGPLGSRGGNDFGPPGSRGGNDFGPLGPRGGNDFGPPRTGPSPMGMGIGMGMGMGQTGGLVPQANKAIGEPIKNGPPSGQNGNGMPPSFGSHGSHAMRPGGRVEGGIVMDVMRGLPDYVLEESRGFALNCMVPNLICGGLIGRGGACTKEVESRTGVRVAIRDIPGDRENRSLTITGPLQNAVAAYMLMMKRYLEVEADAANMPPAHGQH